MPIRWNELCECLSLIYSFALLLLIYNRYHLGQNILSGTTLKHNIVLKFALKLKSSFLRKMPLFWNFHKTFTVTFNYLIGNDFFLTYIHLSVIFNSFIQCTPSRSLMRLQEWQFVPRKIVPKCFSTLFFIAIFMQPSNQKYQKKIFFISKQRKDEASALVFDFWIWMSCLQITNNGKYILFLDNKY